MGTHPIFESDFDCLTDLNLRCGLKMVEIEENSELEQSQCKEPIPPCESGLLRLFYSELFDASMALQYLFKSRDSGILQFLGNRLFDLSKVDLDFYLPQLLILYLYTE